VTAKRIFYIFLNFKLLSVASLTFNLLLFQSTIGWRKLRNIVQWTPFFQTYKNKQRYPWVQLAGHQGNFKAGLDSGTVLKKLSPKEEICFRALMKDVLRPYVPEFRGVVDGDGDENCDCELMI
jgi:1D-myo-inositol-triphosphate 3-kinase